MMIKKIALALVTPLIAMSFAACGPQEEEYVAVCVDPNTEQRLDDDACDSGDSDFLAYAVVWYMLANSTNPYPPVGGSVNKSYYKTSLPKGYTSKPHFGLPKTGGTSVKSYSSTTSWGSKTSKSGWGSSGGSTKPGGTTYRAPAPRR